MNYENRINRAAFQRLGYNGFLAMPSLKEFETFLSDDLVKDNVLVIMSGSLAEKVIEIINNQGVKKVQKAIIFCNSLEYHLRW